MNQHETRFLIFNGIAFYIYWWLCFLGASKEEYFYGPIIGILYIIIHFIIIDNKFKEFKYILICMLFGFFVETLMLKFDFIFYKGILANKLDIAPFWIIILWMGFGTTVFHSFKWILGRYKLSVLLGSIFTPIAYMSADKIGAITFNYSLLISYLILSFIWGITLLLLIYIADKIT